MAKGSRRLQLEAPLTSLAAASAALRMLHVFTTSPITLGYKENVKYALSCFAF